MTAAAAAAAAVVVVAVVAAAAVYAGNVRYSKPNNYGKNCNKNVTQHLSKISQRKLKTFLSWLNGKYCYMDGKNDTPLHPGK